MASKGKKGTVGKKTGVANRKAIKSAVNKCNTLEQIGRATGRSASTISKIASGEIKNPPAGLSARINKMSKKCK